MRVFRVVFARDVRLYNFVCECVASNALEDIKPQMSVANSSQPKRTRKIGRKRHQGKRTDGYRIRMTLRPCFVRFQDKELQISTMIFSFSVIVNWLGKITACAVCVALS